MTLRDYLAEAQLNRQQFAERIGVSAEAVRRYINGERIPEKPIMEKIALATGSKVTANDFFGMAA